MTKLSNMEMWNYLRTQSPQFKSETAKATQEYFNERTFTQLQQKDSGKVLNDFFHLSMRVTLGKIDVAKVKDVLADNGFGEEVLNPLGGYIQRLAINMMKPVSPAYLGLKNGDSPDPFVVRKAVVNERFFEQNAEFQNLLTIPDEVIYRQIFVSEYGMDEFISGMMLQLENSYRKFNYLNKLEALNAGLNNEDLPLKESQSVGVTFSDDPTDAELASFVLDVKNVISAMNAVPSTSAFNQLGFDSAIDTSKLKLLVRPGFKNEIAVKLLSGTFNPDQLNIPVDIIETQHFGGLKPFKEADFKTPLFPVFDKLGTEIGFAETEGAETVTVENDEVFWQDPNEDIVAILADKDVVFTAKQGTYSVEPVRNPRGLYTNYWASAPRGTFAYDALYTLVAFKKDDVKKK